LVNVPIIVRIIGRPLDSQTGYSILAVGLALIIGSLVELRLDILEGKIDELRASRNPGCPRGHIWPVDACPYCRRDSHYL
jgi:hypothetical protein